MRENGKKQAVSVFPRINKVILTVSCGFLRSSGTPMQPYGMDVQDFSSNAFRLTAFFCTLILRFMEFEI